MHSVEPVIALSPEVVLLCQTQHGRTAWTESKNKKSFSKTQEEGIVQAAMLGELSYYRIEINIKCGTAC